MSPVEGQLRFQPSSTCKVQNHNVSAITVGAAKTNAVHFFNRCCIRGTQWDINTDQSAVHGHVGVVGAARVTCLWSHRLARSIGDLQDIARAVRARDASFDRHQHAAVAPQALLVSGAMRSIQANALSLLGGQARIEEMQLTYRYRIKDKHAKRLNAQARAVNFVWNYCNETQMKAARDGRKRLSGYDLGKLVAGATKEGLDLHSHSAKRVCIQYDKSRRQHKKPWLRWRSRRALGWVPFNTGHVAYRDGGFVFRGERYEVWLHRPLPEGARIRAGSFSEDTRGRWYINCPVEVSEGVCLPGSWRWTRNVGIDLGLKDLATLSSGEKVQVPKFYRRSEERLATVQRARKTKRARAIHAKIANRRKDFLHKASAKLA